MVRDDRSNMKRGPYIKEDTYNELKSLSDITNNNIRDTLDELILIFAAFDDNEEAYGKLNQLADNTDSDKGQLIVNMIDVSVNNDGSIIINPLKAKMD